MDFNPDEYLAQKNQPQGGFNPDEYLAQKQPKSLAGVAGEAISNIPSSIGNLVGGIAQTVIHPIDTATNIGKLVVGTGEALTGKLAQAVNPELTAAPSEREQMANQMGNYYANRYGSAEGFKQALAKDPAGVMADAASVLGLGGAALSKAGIARAGEALTSASSAVDPLANVARGISGAATVSGKAIAPALGMTTGAGAEAIKNAYQAGKQGGQAAEKFQGNLRGNLPMQDVLDTAKSDLANMNAAKTAEYRANMDAVRTDKTVLDFNNIDKSLVDNAQKVMFGSQIKNAPAADALKKISDTIGEWKGLDPSQYHTPEGLDALKQTVGGILESIPFEEKTARMVAGDVYNSIKNEITKQAPTYAKTMQDYSDASDQIKEIERALSLGQKASADTSMRKLQSLMRNNASTNYGNRLNLAQQLEQQGGQQIMPALAGQALNSWTPRGLQSATTIPAALMAGPGILAAASPRLVGEAAYYAGKGANKGNQAVNALAQRLKVNPRVAANILYQMNQPK